MFNQFTGVGRLAAEVETRYAKTGTQIANFTLCCDHGWGDNKKTEFVRCVAFGKLAEICTEYLAKGSLCLIQGAMQTRKWQDQSGNDRYTTEIVARDMQMLSPKQGSDNNRGYEPPQDTGEKLPF